MKPKIGRPKVDQTKENNTIRMYPDQQEFLRKYYGGVQAWFDLKIKQEMENERARLAPPKDKKRDKSVKAS